METLVILALYDAFFPRVWILLHSLVLLNGVTSFLCCKAVDGKVTFRSSAPGVKLYHSTAPYALHTATSVYLASLRYYLNFAVGCESAIAQAFWPLRLCPLCSCPVRAEQRSSLWSDQQSDGGSVQFCARHNAHSPSCACHFLSCTSIEPMRTRWTITIRCIKQAAMPSTRHANATACIVPRVFYAGIHPRQYVRAVKPPKPDRPVR